MPGLKLPTKASKVGKGFGASQAYIQLIRSNMSGIEAQLDFVKMSMDGGDQFLSCLPKDKKWDEVRNIVSQYWNEEEFFAYEVFNGCNPFTVKICKPDDVHEEFQHLTRANGDKINLSSYAHGDLFVNQYPEIRKYLYPNYVDDRGIFALEPEILSCHEDGKLKVLAIGFYFGKNATDFEVFTPSGISWRGKSTPPNLWMLAKNHALCADS